MSDAIPYIVAAEWGDLEWRAIAANPNRTEAEFAVYKAGPRRHPYGSLAVEVDGLIFPSQDDADAYAKANAPAPVKRKAEPEATAE